MEELRFNRCKNFFFGVISIVCLCISCIYTIDVNAEANNNHIVIENHPTNKTLKTDYTTTTLLTESADNINNYNIKDYSTEIYTNKPNQSLNKKSKTKLKIAISSLAIAFIALGLGFASHKGYRYYKEQKMLKLKYGVNHRW